MARQLIADVRRIDRALAENRRRCAQAVAASGSTLTDIFGISDVLAAKILGHTGDITRFASADHYASYTGTAPVEVSSGEQSRHRLSRAGNRSLNHALHMAARVQTMHPGPGRNHYQRKQAEHKTPAEALRSLKRQLAKVVYRHLRSRPRRIQPSPTPRIDIEALSSHARPPRPATSDKTKGSQALARPTASKRVSSPPVGTIPTASDVTDDPNHNSKPRCDSALRTSRPRGRCCR